MAIFKCLNNLYISTTRENVRVINTWKRTRCNLAKVFNHITFVRRALEERLVPIGFRRKITTQCFNQDRMMNNVGRFLMKGNLAENFEKLKRLKVEELRCRNSLLSRLNSSSYEVVDQKITVCERKVFSSIRSKQLRKFNSLSNVASRSQQVPSAEPFMRDRFVNLSSRVLSEGETRLLNRGLKFIPSDFKSDFLNISVETELALRRLDLKDKGLPDQIKTIIQEKDKQEDNLTNLERTAISDLQKDESIVITSSDKGGVTLVVDKVDYIRKLEEQIESGSYELLKKDPTIGIDKCIRKIASRIKKEEHQKKGVFYRIVSYYVRNPSIFGLFKVHKWGLPIRCIISNFGTVTEKAAKFIQVILKDFVTLDENSDIILNITHLKKEIKKVDFGERNILLASVDVTNMFGSISQSKALQVITDKVRNHSSFHATYQVSPDDFLELCGVVLNNSFFEYGGLFYKQVFGIPMGSGASPVIADLVMLEWECKVRNEPGYDHVLFYKRYRDDCLLAWEGNEGSLSKFVDDCNKIDEDIQLTLEVESENSLPFLDAKLTRKGSFIEFSVYSKPFSSGIVMDFGSFHDQATKGALVVGETARYINISDALEVDLIKLTEKLEENNFPRSFIKRNIENTARRMKNRNSESHITSKNKDRGPGFISMGYPGKNKAKRIRKACKSYGVKVSFRKKVNLSGMFSRSFKYSSETKMNRGVVYKLNCACGKFYVGETGNLEARIYKHKYAVKSLDLNNGPAAHSVDCGLGMLWGEVETLTLEGDWYRRKIKEGLWIQKLKPELNLSKGYPVIGSWN